MVHECNHHSSYFEKRKWKWEIARDANLTLAVRPGVIGTSDTPWYQLYVPGYWRGTNTLRPRKVRDRSIVNRRAVGANEMTLGNLVSNANSGLQLIRNGLRRILDPRKLIRRIVLIRTTMSTAVGEDISTTCCRGSKRLIRRTRAMNIRTVRGVYHLCLSNVQVLNIRTMTCRMRRCSGQLRRKLSKVNLCAHV